MARTKIVTMDNCSIVIAPLTVEQVEQLIGPPDQLEKPRPVDTYAVLCAGLNNAQAADAEQWNAKRLRAAFDPLYLNFLFSEVLEFTGLRTATPGE